jgi:hypothetical protein
LTHIKPRTTQEAETTRDEKAASNQIARLDADSPKALIGLTELELDEKEMMACSFTRIRSTTAGLRQAAARDADEAVAHACRLREPRPQ